MLWVRLAVKCELVLRCLAVDHPVRLLHASLQRQGLALACRIDRESWLST
jgi:hypothetical protein